MQRKRLPFTMAKDWTVPAVFVALMVFEVLGFLDNFGGVAQGIGLLAVGAICWDVLRDLDS